MPTRKVTPEDVPLTQEAEFAEQIGNLLADLPKDEAISLALSMIMNNIAIAKHLCALLEATDDPALHKQGKAARFHMIACMMGAFRETAKMLGPRDRHVKAVLLRLVSEYEADVGPLDLDTVRITIDYAADQGATDGTFEFPDGTVIQ